jgi:hypothetical protein
MRCAIQHLPDLGNLTVDPLKEKVTPQRKANAAFVAYFCALVSGFGLPPRPHGSVESVKNTNNC